MPHVAESSFYSITIKDSTHGGKPHAAHHVHYRKAQNSLCSLWGVMEGLCWKAENKHNFIFNDVNLLTFSSTASCCNRVRLWLLLIYECVSRWTADAESQACVLWSGGAWKIQDYLVEVSQLWDPACAHRLSDACEWLICCWKAVAALLLLFLHKKECTVQRLIHVCRCSTVSEQTTVGVWASHLILHAHTELLIPHFLFSHTGKSLF